MKKTVNELLEMMDSKVVVDVAKIKENIQIHPMQKIYTEDELKRKSEKSTTKINRKNDVLCHVVFPTIQLKESDTDGTFTQDEFDFIVQSAFRRAESNHVHYSKRNKEGEITARYSNIDSKNKYIDKFKLMVEYDNCFNEFYKECWRMKVNSIEKNGIDKIFVYHANCKLERAKELTCKLAFTAVNCIEKAILELGYYKTSKVKAERDFNKNATSINDTENEKFSAFDVVDTKVISDFDMVNILVDLRRLLTSTHWDIIQLKMNRQLTHREIANELHTSTKTVQKVVDCVREYLLDKKVEIEYCR